MITKVLIANRGDNGCAAVVAAYCRACAAGGGDLAVTPSAEQEASA